MTDQLAPGSDLSFTLEGTPRGRASVRLSGINKNIVLSEVERGVYEGSYTLSRRDRLGPQPTATATLRVRNVSKVVTQALAAGPPPVASPPPPPAAPPLAIERFTVVPVARIEPGAELRFAAAGTPGARATLSIDGVVQSVPMQEVRPGRYEGAYTIRRNDNFPPSLNIVATLEGNGQTIRSRLNQALLVDARPPTVRNLAPQNNETVAGNPVSVSATFDDRGGVGVDPKSVKIMIGGQDVTRNASITPQFLTWRGDLRPGAHSVEVTAADMAGNAVRQTWVFNVAGPQTPPPAATLPLQITSHANNAQISSGTVEVRGRTAPDTKVDVQVQVIASVAGFSASTSRC
ncbi:Ig-like domain-containing protein [Polaromonas sp. P1(28)-8]|nr:Ig-like domain-containing protein [Polaromonas sp. P1(28)-8]